MKHGAKNHSNTRKILNNNNVNVHTHARMHPPAHTHTHTHTHITHSLFFWLTNNLKHSINYNKTKFLKQQNINIEILNRPQHINYRQHFVGAQIEVSLLQTTQMKQGVSFTAANKVYTSTYKITIVEFGGRCRKAVLGVWAERRHITRVWAGNISVGFPDKAGLLRHVSERISVVT